MMETAYDDSRPHGATKQFPAVPTNDVQVRVSLRRLGQPITLFGEDASDRRSRLIKLQAGEGSDIDVESHAESEDETKRTEEEFYTEGSPQLLQTRKDIALYSLPRAKARTASQKLQSIIPLRTHIKHRKSIKDRLLQFDLYASQIAGERPVSITRFAPSGDVLAAANWGGGIKILDVPNLDEQKTLRGHTGLVGGLSWMPATSSESRVSPSNVSLASGGGEGNVHLWSMNQETPVSTLSGHSGRVCRVEFHPSGRYLASASFDTTWRLWDVESSSEIQLQEGHSREVYTVSFNGDGSLLASAGLDSIGRIWDLRTGRTVMILDGHIKEIYALDWGSDGHRVLSGSGDGWIKCWDVRMVRGVGGVGAHKSTVSDIRWFKGTETLNMGSTEDQHSNDIKPATAGTFFVSSGYDKSVNLFSADDWALVKSLSGHSGNVMSVDISHDARWIASSGQDRTVKLWGCDDGKGM